MLNERTDRLASGAANREAARKARTLRLKELEVEIRYARDVMAVMDGLLLVPAQYDEALREKWKSAKRLGAKLGRPSKRTLRLRNAKGP